MGVIAPYEWASVNRFVNRTAELKVLEDWFDDPHSLPLAMFGRRRVGKSWLLRRFAHGRPAVVLVGERLTEGMQFDRFARQLAPLLGVTPRFDDLAELITVLLRLGRNEPITVVIDEFPYLLPTTHAEADRTLSRIQAVFEEELAGTSTKLVLSGSVVSQMAGLFAEHSPLHGRLRGFELTPLAFDATGPFLDGLSPDERMERYAICGGVPRYLDLLGRGPLGAALVSGALGPNTPLWNEGRSVVEQELRQPGAYFGILQMLSTGDKEMNELAQSMRTEANVVSKYLSTLVSMRLVARRLPIGAAAGSRQGNWYLVDPFLQFWFRFVFPHQADLEAGLPGAHLFEEEIKPALSDHVAWHFEEWARSTVRRDGLATTVGAWWGPAMHNLRRRGVRSSEEIDVVGMTRGTVTVVGEAKWTRKLMSAVVLDDLLEFKIPALQQAGLRVASDRRIRLFSRSGYERRLIERTTTDSTIELVDVAALVDASAIATSWADQR